MSTEAIERRRGMARAALKRAQSWIEGIELLGLVALSGAYAELANAEYVAVAWLSEEEANAIKEEVSAMRSDLEHSWSVVRSPAQKELRRAG
jgi:hypothetical protein